MRARLGTAALKYEPASELLHTSMRLKYEPASEPLKCTRLGTAAHIFQVDLQKSIPTQIPQLVLDISNSKG